MAKVLLMLKDEAGDELDVLKFGDAIKVFEDNHIFSWREDKAQFLTMINPKTGQLYTDADWPGIWAIVDTPIPYADLKILEEPSFNEADGSPAVDGSGNPRITKRRNWRMRQIDIPQAIMDELVNNGYYQLPNSPVVINQFKTYIKRWYDDATVDTVI